MSIICGTDTDILRPLTKSELLVLAKLYTQKGERYHCMSIYNHCHWAKKLEQVDDYSNEKWKPMKTTFYTHRHGDLLTDGTYISLQWDKMLSVQFHTLEKSLHKLKECLRKTNLINWKTEVILTAIHTDFTDEIVELIQTLGGVFEYEIPCTCFVLPRYIAHNIQVPRITEGYEFRPLDERHAEYIHGFWPHNNEASVDFIRGLIQFNLNLGVFRQNDCKLIAWIFQNEFFGLGILQVIDEEQGKGFAKLLSSTMSKLIADLYEYDITSFAVVNNVKSETILQKIGYKKNCVTKWIGFKNINCTC